MSAIHCKTTVYKIDDHLIVRLPKEASAKLPARGQVMVKGTINGQDLQTPLEPDGTGSHWFDLGKTLSKTIQAEAGDDVVLDIEPTKEWPEPDVPAEWKKALADHPEAQALWDKITPLARWEWIRWARATNRDETRKRRIEVGCSKLTSGERRPCCWNRNLCTEPSVSKNGVLLKLS